MLHKDNEWRLFDILFYNVFQLPNRTPPTPVRASQARWVGVRIHVILLGKVGKRCIIVCLTYSHQKKTKKNMTETQGKQFLSHKTTAM